MKFKPYDCSSRVKIAQLTREASRNKKFAKEINLEIKGYNSIKNSDVSKEDKNE